MRSIFTDDLTTCYVTGRKGWIEVHHIFPGANRTRSTFYGYVVPLLAPIHINGSQANDKECRKLTGMSLKELDLMLRQKCQRHYETELGKSREEWLEEFKRSYL